MYSARPSARCLSVKQATGTWASGAIGSEAARGCRDSESPREVDPGQKTDSAGSQGPPRYRDDVSAKSEIARRLARGPAFLLLGQDYLALETGSDPLLREVGRKLGHEAPPSSYLDLLDQDVPMTREAWLAWLDERCRRIAAPTWLETVAEYSWSGFYTSAIDSVWPRVMRRPWRELQPLFEEKFRPSDPQPSRSSLHVSLRLGQPSR